MKDALYDKRDDFDFDFVNFPFLDRDVVVLPLMVFTTLSFFGLQECLDIWLTSMLITKLWLPNFYNKAIGIINLGKLFSKCHRLHYELVSIYDTKLKTFLLQGLAEPELYGDLMYKFRKM